MFKVNSLNSILINGKYTGLIMCGYLKKINKFVIITERIDKKKIEINILVFAFFMFIIKYTIAIIKKINYYIKICFYVNWMA